MAVCRRKHENMECPGCGKLFRIKTLQRKQRLAEQLEQLQQAYLQDLEEMAECSEEETPETTSSGEELTANSHTGATVQLASCVRGLPERTQTICDLWRGPPAGNWQVREYRRSRRAPYSEHRALPAARTTHPMSAASLMRT